MTKRSIRKRKNKGHKENAFLSSLAYDGVDHIPTSIELIRYNQEYIRITDITDQANLKETIAADSINWIKIVGIADTKRISDICREFGLHGFDIKDLLSDQMTTKAVVYDQVTFVLLPAYTFNSDNELVSTHVGFILGANYVISIQESEDPFFDDIRDALIDNYGMLRQGAADYLLYILLNAVNSLYVNVVANIEDELFVVEDQLIAQNNSSKTMNFLHMCRLDYTRIKRSIISMREENINLLHNANGLIADRNIVYFNDYDDKLRTVMSSLETCHELLNSLLDLYYSNINMRMNEIMKRLTLVSTIFIPLTFMAGVWGMNFTAMPELSSPYGYIIAWCTFIVIAAASYYFLKKRRWF